jgi:transposase InsO family protein
LARRIAFRTQSLLRPE